ncbi:DUF3800 domain-containing protein [Candidatus Daviesbacteria bacterium]|nr:DUF3800 domain-containing protein [Candidatus Daviesbacteria bacterium]
MPPKRFYCYVDETGQDTLGDIFVVTVVIPENKDEVLEYLEKVEVQSGKEKFKWGKADPNKRFAYIETILSQRKHPLKIYFSFYGNTKEYKALTILTIFKAVHSIKDFKNHKFIISVDALGEKDRRFYGSELHKLGIPSRQVKGIRREESNTLIRLADSVCGFVRDILEEKPKSERDERLTKLYKKAVKEDVLIEV